MLPAKPARSSAPPLKRDGWTDTALCVTPHSVEERHGISSYRWSPAGRGQAQFFQRIGGRPTTARRGSGPQPARAPERRSCQPARCDSAEDILSPRERTVRRARPQRQAPLVVLPTAASPQLGSDPTEDLRVAQDGPRVSLRRPAVRPSVGWDSVLSAEDISRPSDAARSVHSARNCEKF